MSGTLAGVFFGGGGASVAGMLETRSTGSTQRKRINNTALHVKKVAVWLSGNIVGHNKLVTLRYAISVFNQATQANSASALASLHW